YLPSRACQQVLRNAADGAGLCGKILPLFPRDMQSSTYRVDGDDTNRACALPASEKNSRFPALLTQIQAEPAAHVSYRRTAYQWFDPILPSTENHVNKNTNIWCSPVFSHPDIGVHHFSPVRKLKLSFTLETDIFLTGAVYLLQGTRHLLKN
ncbi:MAG TPA: hypothetical protein H9695_02260, partial [Candidatus Mediterraneibacter excrementigallinarum]|nr:hypothetical protein [Candidatus Mediterraneibacter excrementigallinarum]